MNHSEIKMKMNDHKIMEYGVSEYKMNISTKKQPNGGHKLWQQMWD